MECLQPFSWPLCTKTFCMKAVPIGHFFNRCGSNINYKYFDKKLSVLLQRFCHIQIGDSSSHSNEAGGDTTVVDYYSV